jgi:hypothetical protein
MRKNITNLLLYGLLCCTFSVFLLSMIFPSGCALP